MCACHGLEQEDVQRDVPANPNPNHACVRRTHQAVDVAVVLQPRVWACLHPVQVKARQVRDIAQHPVQASQFLPRQRAYVVLQERMRNLVRGRSLVEAVDGEDPGATGRFVTSMSAHRNLGRKYVGTSRRRERAPSHRYG
jgi:hypothetical protein